ncbi:MAG: hypothetical protein H0S85_06610 [Desulfovibrionaceae bacterium]|jgi:hypothetical protein|nr:hypothetical protein [Desulfovibrionaceae bacterium]
MRGAREVSERLNTRQRIVVLAMDAALLAELTGTIYVFSGNPDTMTANFIKYFLPMLLVTVFVARRFIRLFDDNRPEKAA